MSETQILEPDYEIMQRFVDLIHPNPYAVIGLHSCTMTHQLMPGRTTVLNNTWGCYNHRDALGHGIAGLHTCDNICIELSVNHHSHAVIDQANNHLQQLPDLQSPLTQDNLISLNWLPIRISSSNTLYGSREGEPHAEQAIQLLADNGLQDPVKIRTGDAWFLLYRIQLEPSGWDLLDRFYEALGNRLDNDPWFVNAGYSSRYVCPLPGSVGRFDFELRSWHLDGCSRYGRVEWLNPDMTPRLHNQEELSKALNGLDPQVHAAFASDSAFKRFHAIVQKQKQEEFAEQMSELIPDLSEVKATIQPCDHYVSTESGMYLRHSNGKRSVLSQLTNFTAKVVIDNYQFNGSAGKRKRSFVLECSVEGTAQLFQVEVDSQEFDSMKWIRTKLGPSARIFPRPQQTQHLQNAIQAASTEIQIRSIYNHTGWVEMDGEPVFLHSGGGIGVDGPRDGVYCTLPAGLKPYQLLLPESLDEEQHNCRQVLELMEMINPEVSVPLIALTLRAVLGDNQLGVMVVGRYSTFKTSLCIVAQQFFGTGFGKRRLPASFKDSENALRGLAHLASCVLFLLDDSKNDGNSETGRQSESKIETVAGGAADGAGRQRMNKEIELVEPDVPRCATLVTGESYPTKQALRSRLWFIPIEQGSIDPNMLQQAQELAEKGVYCRSVGGYVRWLAQHYERLVKNVEKRFVAFRSEVSVCSCARTNELVAVLMIGLSTFLEYCVSIDAITQQEAELKLDSYKTLLFRLGQQQSTELEEESPARRMLDLLGQALANSKAIVNGTDGRRPFHAAVLGWNHPASSMSTAAKFGSEPIGWVDYSQTDALLYLLPDPALRVAQAMSGANEEIRAFSSKQMGARLKSEGLLAITDKSRNTPLYRKTIDGAVQKVWAIHLKQVVAVNQAEQLMPKSTGLKLPSAEAIEAA